MAGIIALLVPIYFVAIVADARSVAEERQRDLADATTIGENVAETINAFSLDVENTIDAVALGLGTREGRLNQDAAGPYLAAVLGEYPALRSIFLTDLDGRLIASQDGEQVGLDLSSRPYIRALAAGRDRVWTERFAGLETGEAVVTYARIVPGAGGAPRAYLAAAFYPRSVRDRIQVRMPPDADITLLDQQGSVLFSSSREDLARAGTNLRGAPGVQEALAGAVVSIAGSASPFEEESRIGVLAPVPNTGWVLAFTRPQGRLEASLRDRLILETSVITLVGAVATLFVIAVTHSVTRPLRVLTHTAEQITRNQPTVIPTLDADPDVEELAAAMQLMSRSVADREEALRFQKTLLEAQSEASLDGILVASDTGEVLAFNRRMAAMWSLSPEEIRECSLEELGARIGTRIEAPEGYQPLARALHEFTGETSRQELRLTDGRFIDEYSAPIVAPQKTHQGRVWYFRDITRLKQAEERLQVLYQEARDALELRQEFLSIASHELKTPLASIKIYVQLLSRSRALRESRESAMVNDLAAQVDRLEALVADLLDASRVQQGRLMLDLAPIDLAELARRVIDRFEHAAERTELHRLELQAPAPVIGIWDGARLDQVLTNLVSNALKYSPKGGLVRVSVTATDGGGAVLSVEDEGIGIPAEEMPKLFEPFVRLSGAGHISGTGLGLYITRELVSRHGGSIECDSRPGGGTTFIVRLPPAAPAGEETEQAALRTTSGV